MKSLRWGAVVLAVAVIGGALSTACHPTFVVVPTPGQDTIVDTVVVNGVPTRTMRIFRVDTVTRIDTVVRTRTVSRPDTVLRVDTVVRLDTIYRTRVGAARVDTVLRVDTLRVVRVDTILRVDTVQVASGGSMPPRLQPRPGGGRPARVDTVFRVDTILRVDTLTVPVTETVVRVDTVLRVDTLTVPVTETIVRVDTVTRVDTVRVAGRRMLFVPPGHYPPAGQCRVWVHDLPPGKQAKAAPCDALGAIPPGAFILFGGDAWDFDYDWVWEAERNPGTVPPEILAVTRPGAR